MDVMAVSSQSCLDLSTELETQQQIQVTGCRCDQGPGVTRCVQVSSQVPGPREDPGLETATYLGGVTVSEGGEGGPPYLHFVTETAAGAGAELGGGVYSGGAGAGAVYVSPSLYPSSSSPTTTTYYDTSLAQPGPSLPAGYTAAAGAGAGQSQLVSYAGSTFLIQPAPDGSSAPLITAVTTRPDPESPGPGLAGAGQGAELSPGHSLSYATRVSPATIQWLIANYETAEGVSLPRSTLYR